MKLCFCLEFPKGCDDLSQVQGKYTLTIQPAQQQQNPLTITPPSATLPDAQEGQPYSQQFATVSGGVAPYSYALDPSSDQPSSVGLELAEDSSGNVTLSGTPTVPTPGSPATINVVLNVTDSDGNTAQVARKLIA